jgi:hypothetical protein
MQIAQNTYMYLGACIWPCQSEWRWTSTSSQCPNWSSFSQTCRHQRAPPVAWCHWSSDQWGPEMWIRTVNKGFCRITKWELIWDQQSKAKEVHAYRPDPAVVGRHQNHSWENFKLILKVQTHWTNSNPQGSTDPPKSGYLHTVKVMERHDGWGSSDNDK